MSTILVSYFSATGNTRVVANIIKEVLNADLYEIEPTIAYTSDDLDWTNKNSRSSIEMNDINSRPAIKNSKIAADLYDTIIIGFPVWWYKAPTIINTFIENNNLAFKNVYIFVTSGSSTVDSSLADLKKKYPNINFISGKRFTTDVTSDEINNWIKVNGEI